MAEVVLNSVSKSFGDTKAVDGVSMTIPDGAFVVLLGPTGAGKTTTLRMIAGLERPDSGDVAIAGSRGRAHPTFALLPLDLADDLAAFLAAGGSRRARDWLARHDPAIVDFDDGPDGLDPFFNINTPSDLAAIAGCAGPRLGES